MLFGFLPKTPGKSRYKTILGQSIGKTLIYEGELPDFLVRKAIREKKTPPGAHEGHRRGKRRKTMYSFPNAKYSTNSYHIN